MPLPDTSFLPLYFLGPARDTEASLGDPVGTVILEADAQIQCGKDSITKARLWSLNRALKPAELGTPLCLGRAVPSPQLGFMSLLQLQSVEIDHISK